MDPETAGPEMEMIVWGRTVSVCMLNIGPGLESPVCGTGDVAGPEETEVGAESACAGARVSPGESWVVKGAASGLGAIRGRVEDGRGHVFAQLAVATRNHVSRISSMVCSFVGQRHIEQHGMTVCEIESAFNG